MYERWRVFRYPGSMLFCFCFFEGGGDHLLVGCKGKPQGKPKPFWGFDATKRDTHCSGSIQSLVGHQKGLQTQKDIPLNVWVCEVPWTCAGELSCVRAG